MYTCYICNIYIILNTANQTIRFYLKDLRFDEFSPISGLDK